MPPTWAASSKTRCPACPSPKRWPPNSTTPISPPSATMPHVSAPPAAQRTRPPGRPRNAKEPEPQLTAFNQESPMANNAIFARLANLWTGFISLWVSDIEKEHPEIAYQNAIASMIQKYTQLKAATGAIIARRQDITSRLEAHESEIDKLKAEKERMLAQMHSAQARIKIQGQLDGLSVDAEVQALGAVREHIKGQVAQASLGAELQNSDLDVRLNKLRQSSGSVTAKAQLEAMKQAREIGR